MKTYLQDNNGAKERILVVDDERDLVDFCLKVLSLKGYEALGTTSGPQALDLARQQHFDLLLTDVMMPEISGLDLLARIRTTTPDIAAVVITGYGTIDMAVKALRAGARDFVTKPFAIDDLVASIKHALSETQLLRENIRLKALVPVLEASQRFSGTLELERLLSEIVRATVQIAHADAGALFLISGKGLERRASLNWPNHSNGAEYARRIFTPVLEAETDVLAIGPDAEAYPGVGQFLESLGFQSMLCLPLRVDGRPIGLLSLGKSRNSRVSFDDGDVEVVSILGTQASVAIERARLFGELEQARRDLEKWNRELEARVAERTRELREAQEHLVRMEKLAVIGKLGSGVAHELRNPLGVISNSIYYLNLTLGDADPKVRKHLQIIDREVVRSNKIITDLMSFVRVAELDAVPSDINELITEAQEETGIPSAIEVETSLQEDLPQVRLDPGKIKQVLVNLLTNAVQAMSGQGKLGIASRAQDGSVCIEVSDTGCGIDPEVMDKIWEPLFTTKAKGIGLGLAISKMLVENHGGHIYARNNCDGGATFSVELPAQSASRGDGEAAEEHT